MKKQYQAVIIDFDCITPTLQPTIAQLKAQGKRIGIIAKADSLTVAEGLKSAALDGRVDAVISREAVKTFKPNPQGLIKAMQQLRSNGRNTIFVGNCKSGALMAQRIRVDFIGVTSERVSQKDFDNYDAFHVLEDVKGIEQVLN